MLRNETGWSKFVNTDGAPTRSGKYSKLTANIPAIIQNIKWIHCCTGSHRESVAAREMPR
jgi:hypothetical protein